MDACCLQKYKCVIDLRMVSIKKNIYKETLSMFKSISNLTLIYKKAQEGQYIVNLFPWSPFLSFPLSQLLLNAFFLLCLWLLVPVCPLALVFLLVPSPFPAIVSPPALLLLALLQASLSSISRVRSSKCVLFLAGSGLAEDEAATATSRPDEAIRAGGVMEGLPPIASSMAAYHFQDAAVGSPSSVLTLVCGHFRSYRNVQNIKSLILITQFK